MAMPMPMPERKPQFGKRVVARVARMQVTLAAETNPISDVAFVVEALQGIAVGALRAAMVGPAEGLLADARGVLFQRPDDRRLNFGRDLIQETIDLADPFDVSLESATNTWVRRTLFIHDETMYRNLFSFATVSDARRNSPLLIELTVAAGIVVGGLALPVVLATGIMKAVTVHRQWKAEADIRQTEAKLKREQLKQAQIQTKIMDQVADAIKEQAEQNQLKVPDEVLSTAVKVSSPAVADLSKGSLVEKVTFGISTGGKAA